MLNTICRTIGNISAALSSTQSYKGSEMMLVQEITRIINTFKDTGCLQSSLRTIRKLFNAGVLNEELRVARTIPAIVNNLLLKDKDVSVAALKSLETVLCLNGNCNLLSELWYPDISPLRVLVDCTSLSNDSDDHLLIDNTVIVLLCRCIQHVDGKAAVSRAGGIDLLVKYFPSCPKNSDLYSSVLDSLCLCCRDVHGRQKIRDLNGLELLIDLVHDDSASSFHENILSALICYYFDEHTLRHMVMKLNLMKSVVHHLKGFTNKQIPQQPAIHDSTNTDTNKLSFDENSSSAIDSDFDPSPILDTCVSPLSSSSVVADHGSSDTESVEMAPSSDTVTNQPSTSNTQSSKANTVSVSFSDEFLKSCSSSVPLLSPSSRQVSLDIDTSDSMPVDYVDSLLTSPTLSYSNISGTSNNSSIPLLGSDTGDSIEGKVLLLLSRLSHLHDCQPILATPDSFTAILQYFFATDGHNRGQIFKILSKILRNPLCFQDCLINHAPSLLFMHFKTHSTDLLQSSSCSPSTGSHQTMSKELFDMLSHVARLPYGQGVIAHMLLRGDDKCVTAGTLALSLLQK